MAGEISFLGSDAGWSSPDASPGIVIGDSSVRTYRATMDWGVASGVPTDGDEVGPVPPLTGKTHHADDTDSQVSSPDSSRCVLVVLTLGEDDPDFEWSSYSTADLFIIDGPPGDDTESRWFDPTWSVESAFVTVEYVRGESYTRWFKLKDFRKGDSNHYADFPVRYPLAFVHYGYNGNLGHWWYVDTLVTREPRKFECTFDYGHDGGTYGNHDVPGPTFAPTSKDYDSSNPGGALEEFTGPIYVSVELGESDRDGDFVLAEGDSFVCSEAPANDSYPSVFTRDNADGAYLTVCYYGDGEDRRFTSIAEVYNFRQRKTSLSYPIAFECEWSYNRGYYFNVSHYDRDKYVPPSRPAF